MPDLVSAIYDTAIDNAVVALQEAHSFLVKCATAAGDRISHQPQFWGIAAKRLSVDLRPSDAPRLIGKSQERFVEVINMSATVERLVAFLVWCSHRYPEATVGQCHPSTSADPTGNDLVLHDRRGVALVRCEVCDVVSSKAHQNNKERKDLANLGCAHAVPVDGVDRYICTSPEFAVALASPGRRWSALHYRYDLIQLSDPAETVALLVRPANHPRAS